MFFAPEGQYEACGIFSSDHIVALIICVALIITAVFATHKMSRKTLTRTLRGVSIILIILEIVKIIFRAYFSGSKNLSVASFVPLFYCSLFIYAAFCAGFFKGRAKTAGLAFMFWGGIAGGVCFLLYPATSIVTYPILHYLSLHSMLYHTLMVYFGLIIVITGYYKPSIKHIKHYTVFAAVFFAMAYILNIIFDDNIMFLFRPFTFKVLDMIYGISVPLYRIIFFFIMFYGPPLLTFTGYKIAGGIKNNQTKTWKRNGGPAAGRRIQPGRTNGIR